MKSQDIVVLLKLVSLHQQLSGINRLRDKPSPYLGNEWQGWDEPDPLQGYHEVPDGILADAFSVRGLQSSLGISKSEVNASIKRSYQTGLALEDRTTGYPKANVSSLLEFIVHGLKFVFPAQPGAMERGIPTAAAAPVLQSELISAGEYIHVWPYVQGKALGQALKPLFKSVPHAVRRDPELYASLALIDAIRLGNPREMKVAATLLEKRLTT